MDPEEASWELAESNPTLTDQTYEQLELFGALSPSDDAGREQWARQMCALDRSDEKGEK